MSFAIVNAAHRLPRPAVFSMYTLSGSSGVVAIAFTLRITGAGVKRNRPRLMDADLQPRHWAVTL